MSHYHPLFRSKLLAIDSHSCRAPRTHGWGAELGGEEPGLVLVRRGCFAVRGRIEVVADAFSAMTTDRPYRKGMPHEKALLILESGAGIQWDPACVEAFLRARGAPSGPPMRPLSRKPSACASGSRPPAGGL